MSMESKDKKELERIQLVKNKIMKDHPFFAPGLEALPIIIDRRVPTACTDGNVIRINPDYTETQNMYELEGLLIHEVCHPLFGHFVRFFEPMQNGEGALVNKATDVEINNLLTEYSSEATRPIVLPSGGYVDLDRFGTEAAEHVLKVLREEEQESPDTPPDNPGDDEGESGGDSTGDSEGDGSSEPKDQDGEQGESESTSGSSPGDGQSEGTGGGAGQEPVSPGEFELPQGATQEELRDQEEKWKDILSTSIHASKLRGDTPGKFLERLEKLQKSPLRMQDLLQKYADEFCMDEGSTRFDRRYMADWGVGIVGMEDERIGSLVFVVDSSGSIPSRIAEVACAVVQEAVNTLNAERIIHLDVDTRVCKVREYQPYETVDTQIHGRGGTDFAPAFDWVRDNAEDARVIVYLTDGWGCFPEQEPRTPVLWLSWDADSRHYPFGDVVPLQNLDHMTT